MKASDRSKCSPQFTHRGVYSITAIFSNVVKSYKFKEEQERRLR